MKILTAIVIGAGNRGTSYASIMAKYPDKFKVVGVADSVRTRRENIQKMHAIPDDACFENWEKILAQPRMADIAVVATMDSMHYESAMRAIELGYHLLLEKPVAQTAQECVDIALAAEKKGVSVLVCHVLRYTPFFKKVKELLLEGTIGRPMSVIHVEAPGSHYSHSYIRGNWHSEKETTPMLLAKSCHDLDIIQWLLDKPCKRVQSFGELTYFKSENAPAGAPVRCADGGCPIAETCPHNCNKLYYTQCSAYDWWRSQATKGLTAGAVPTDAEIRKALQTTDYGLCVFHANNDVVDHQVVNMEFDGGATASFSLNAFSTGGRYIRIFGTKGELYANMSDTEIQVCTFADQKKWNAPVKKTIEGIEGGHGGGDDGIIRELYEYLSGSYTGYCAADISTSVKNHLIGFAAEESRHTNTVVDLDEYMRQYGMTNTY